MTVFFGWLLLAGMLFVLGSYPGCDFKVLALAALSTSAVLVGLSVGVIMAVCG